MISIKWWMAAIGWPMAFCFWFQIMVVLFISNGVIGEFNLYIFHFLWIIIVCTFFSALFSPPKSVRQLYNGRIDDLEQCENYCNKCDEIKPRRFHHCRTCNRCIHRMDHHCPILQMCIHSGNHKFFLLFLIWPTFLAIFTVVNGYEYLWMTFMVSLKQQSIKFEQHMMGIGVSNALMVGIAAIYLLKFQLPNLLRNQTLIEESRDDFSYDKGDWKSNVQEVMGRLPMALLPLEEEIVL